MKRLLFIALLVSLVDMASCQNAGSSKGTIRQSVPVEEFEQKLSTVKDAQLIDVRTPGEYSGGHLKNSVNIDYNSDDFEAELSKLDKSKPVFVYCLSGGRSSRAASKMQDMGFAEVYNMDGGIMKWTNAGKPTDKGAAPTATGSITAAEFNKSITASKFVLVDYNAKWCEPCKKMLPVLESIVSKRKDKLSLFGIDADQNKDLMKQKNIASIPYLELYRDGQLIWKHEGFINEEDLLKETNL